MLFWRKNICTKAAIKMLVKLTLGGDIIDDVLLQMVVQLRESHTTKKSLV